MLILYLFSFYHCVARPPIPSRSLYSNLFLQGLNAFQTLKSVSIEGLSCSVKEVSHEIDKK